MPKIIRTFSINEPTSLSLIKTVNEGKFLHKLASGLKGAIDAVKNAKAARTTPATVTTATKNELPDRPVASVDLQGGSATERIVSELFSDTGTESRLVVFTSLNNLKAMYLKSGGGHALIDSFDPTVLANFKADPLNARGPMVKLKKDFTFSQMVVPRKGQADMAIQIDVPNALWAQLETAASEEEIKNVLTKMMSHKYYVMTLSTRKSNAIRPAMGTARGTEERAEVFDPNIVANYPIRSVLMSAIAEWNDRQAAPEKEKEEATAAKEREAGRKERADKAETTLKGDQEKVRQQMLNIVMSADDATKAAEAVYGQFKGTYSADEIAGILLSLHRKLDSKKIKDAAYKIKPTS